MILTAHQPCYLPWIGLFNKIGLSDTFCLFDIVQYQKKDFNNRNKIILNNNAKWLTVPVYDSGRFDKKISDIRIYDNNWKKKHLKTIEQSYKKTKYFEDYFYPLSKILNSDFKFLVDLNFSILLYFLDVLGMKKRVIKASDFNFKGAKSDLVLDMCLKLKAKKYIFGSQGKNYCDQESFKKNSIEVYFQNYIHPQYDQKTDKFIKNMSIIDLLFNEGPNSYKILMQNNEKLHK